MAEKGWLVEDRSQTRYRTMDQTEIYWTQNVHDAIRFARRADAEMFASGDEDAWHIVEHEFVDPLELHTRSEVMNPPGPAAQGPEAGNLDKEPRHGTGAVPRGAEARPAAAASVPPPYLVRSFWSPDHRFLVTVHVTKEGIIAVQDDDGWEWEAAGEQQNMASTPSGGTEHGK